jgi:divalent metal cation (Fe/Co/Zn/Cd) transporter
VAGDSITRQRLLRRGILLEAAVIAWNVLEGIVAVVAGLLANSVALLGFGIDSFIEVASAAIVLRRLVKEVRGRSAIEAERFEARARQIAGALLLALAAYIMIESSRRLLGYGAQAEESFLGIVLTALSLVAMPLFGWAKLRTAAALHSGALRADAFETIACAWLSLTTLVGLVLNATLGWTWADPLAALLIVPLLLREGWEGWRGETCAEQEE